MTPREALHRLLCSLFGDSAELKLFAGLGPKYQTIITRIDFTNLDRAAYDLIDTYQKHGLLDQSFFKRLVEIRPARRDEILAVAERWDRERSNISAAPTTQRTIFFIGLCFAAVMPSILFLLTYIAPPPSPNPTPDPALTTGLADTPTVQSPPPAPAISPENTQPHPSDKKTPSPARSCRPPPPEKILKTLKAAGTTTFRPCWHEFRTQIRVRPDQSRLALNWSTTSIELSLPRGQQLETRCFSDNIEAALRPLRSCATTISVTFTLADIEP